LGAPEPERLRGTDIGSRYASGTEERSVATS
jgi:hypothetical protein